jgi:hypothetical protein
MAYIKSYFTALAHSSNPAPFSSDTHKRNAICPAGVSIDIQNDQHKNLSYDKEAQKIEWVVNEYVLSSPIIELDGTVHITGDLIVDGTLDASYIVISGTSSTSSDTRLKENISSIENPIDIISKLEGVSFNWIKNGNLSYGLIAQDVSLVMPELVHETSSGFLQLEYTPLIAILIEAVKDLKEEIKALKETINT